MHYDKTRRKLYIFGEIYGVKISNRSLAEKIKKLGWDDIEIIADSSESKSIDEMKNDHDIKKIKGAVKGPGSGEYGEKWLDDLVEIIIDPERCPKLLVNLKILIMKLIKMVTPKIDYKIKIIIVSI